VGAEVAREFEQMRANRVQPMMLVDAPVVGECPQQLETGLLALASTLA
jgi:hypothetical protein